MLLEYFRWAIAWNYCICTFLAEPLVSLRGIPAIYGTQFGNDCANYMKKSPTFCPSKIIFSQFTDIYTMPLDVAVEW
jgi:hypothetical protein